MSTVANFYDLLPKKYKKKVYFNPNKLTPQHTFRLCIVGPSNTGKTNILLNLIEDSKNFRKIYLYAKKLDEPLYQYLVEHWTKKSNQLGIPLIEYSNDISKVVQPGDLDEGIQNLIVFDDMVTESNLSIVRELFIRGRKQNASIVFISQSYFSIPTDVRINSDYFIFTRGIRGNELIQIAKDQASGISQGRFKEMYGIATRDGYNFFLVDNQSKEPFMRFRRNFDHSLNQI
jgi:hypothetical protein